MNAASRNWTRILMAVAATASFSVESCAKSEGTRASFFFSSQPQIALLDAVEAGNTAKIESLLAAGVDVNGTGKGGMTALLWAIGHVNKQGFACLLRHGANPNLQLTTDGTSVVSMAAMHDDIWYLDEVLKHGGDPSLVNRVSGFAPIFDCIFSSSSDRLMTDHILMLIKAGAALNAQDSNGETPMATAATANRYDIVYILIEKGADPTIKNRWGLTLLDPMRRINIDKASPRYQWKLKVIDVLKAKGMDVEHGK